MTKEFQRLDQVPHGSSKAVERRDDHDIDAARLHLAHEVVHNDFDLGIAEALDRHEGTTATLADHFEHAAQLVRQAVPLLRPQT